MKISLHLYASKHEIKDFCRSEQPDAHGSSLAAIVPVSAVGQSIHRRILDRQLAVKGGLALAHWSQQPVLMDAVATTRV